MEKEQELTIDHLRAVMEENDIDLDFFRDWLIAESDERYPGLNVVMAVHAAKRAIRQRREQTGLPADVPLYGNITKKLRKLFKIDVGWDVIAPILTGRSVVTHSQAIAAKWEKQRNNEALDALMTEGEKRSAPARRKHEESGCPLKEERGRKFGGYVAPESLPADLGWRYIWGWDPRTKKYYVTGKESVWVLR